MNRPESVASTVGYGRKLVNAGLSGIRAGQPAAFDGRSLSAVLSETALASLRLAAVGACAGLFGSYVEHRRGRSSHPLAYGIMGSLLVFCAVVSWKSRRVATSLTHSALKEMRIASDEHWLENHPIDYA